MASFNKMPLKSVPLGFQIQQKSSAITVVDFTGTGVASGHKEVQFTGNVKVVVTGYPTSEFTSIFPTILIQRIVSYVEHKNNLISTSSIDYNFGLFQALSPFNYCHGSKEHQKLDDCITIDLTAETMPSVLKFETNVDELEEKPTDFKSPHQRTKSKPQSALELPEPMSEQKPIPERIPEPRHIHAYEYSTEEEDPEGVAYVGDQYSDVETVEITPSQPKRQRPRDQNGRFQRSRPSKTKQDRQHSSQDYYQQDDKPKPQYKGGYPKEQQQRSKVRFEDDTKTKQYPKQQKQKKHYGQKPYSKHHDATYDTQYQKPHNQQYEPQYEEPQHEEHQHESRQYKSRQYEKPQFEKSQYEGRQYEGRQYEGRSQKSQYKGPKRGNFKPRQGPPKEHDDEYPHHNGGRGGYKGRGGHNGRGGYQSKRGKRHQSSSTQEQ